MRRIPVIFGTIGMIVLTVFGFMALNSMAPKPERNEEAAEQSVGVFVETVKRQRVIPNVTTQGEVRARTEIDLFPQITGRIAEVAPEFRAGGIFKKDDVLVRIEEADYELNVIRSKARVADAEQAMVREEAEAEMARRDWEELGAGGEATPLTFREPQLAQARANLEAARADLADAELDLDRTRIIAPFNGRVRLQEADLGQYVAPGTRLGRIFATDIVEIRLPLTDREMGVVGLPIGYTAPPGGGPKVTLYATVAGEPHEWTGEIVRTDSAIDSDTRVLQGIVEVRDPYGASADGDAPLAVGLFVTASIPGRPIEDALVIPRAALRSGNQVYMVDADNRLDKRIVDIAFTEEDRVVLEGGLEEGDKVIVSPMQAPPQGLKVNPVPAGQDTDDGESTP